MKKIKRKNILISEKANKLGIIILCITLFLSAMSLTLSLIPRDKTTSAPPPPVALASFNLSKDNIWWTSMGNLDVNAPSNNSEVFSFSLQEGYERPVELFHSFSFRDVETPINAKKMVMEYTYTLSEHIDNLQFGLHDGSGYSLSPSLKHGKHCVKLVFENTEENFTFQGYIDDVLEIEREEVNREDIFNFDGDQDVIIAGTASEEELDVFLKIHKMTLTFY